MADSEKFYQWLEKASLKDSMEAPNIAAQEQALSTRAREVYHAQRVTGAGCAKSPSREAE